MELLVLVSVISAVLGIPDADANAEADADAYYGQYQWPAALAVGYHGHALSSTCYGCRPHEHLHYGKRDADADAAADADAHYGLYGYAGYAYGVPGGYTHVSRRIGYHYGKRSADADADAH